MRFLHFVLFAHPAKRPAEDLFQRPIRLAVQDPFSLPEHGGQVIVIQLPRLAPPVAEESNLYPRPRPEVLKLLPQRLTIGAIRLGDDDQLHTKPPFAVTKRDLPLADPLLYVRLYSSSCISAL